jgi:hypothetical protein
VQVQNGVTGFLAEDSTQSVLQLMRSESLRQAMGAEARRFACSTDWTGVFEDLYQIYDAALNTEQVRSRVGIRS